MRDAARIDRIVEKLREVWKANPDLRLGQLLVNVIRPSQPCPQVFYPEDTVIENGLEKYANPETDRYALNEVTLELTKAEALILIDFLIRFRDTDELRVEHEGESRVLWDVCALLEKQLSRELLDPAWPKLLDEARQDVTNDSA
jgi:hypothetical protein